MIGGNSKLSHSITATLEKLAQDPKNPTLYSHKVNTAKFGICFSSRVTDDIRLIWRYGDSEIIEVIELLDIGGYLDVYGQV